MNEHQAVKETQGTRRRYEKPNLEVLGRVEDLTQVGLTKPGPDTFPGAAKHEHGSVCPTPAFCP